MRLSESIKKRAGPLRPLREGNLVAPPALSSERSADVRHHPSVATGRSTVRKEALAIMRTAPRGHRDLGDPQCLGPLNEDAGQVNAPRRRLGSAAEALAAL